MFGVFLQREENGIDMSLCFFEGNGKVVLVCFCGGEGMAKWFWFIFWRQMKWQRFFGLFLWRGWNGKEVFVYFFGEEGMAKMCSYVSLEAKGVAEIF